jgi:hypothetical protein
VSEKVSLDAASEHFNPAAKERVQPGDVLAKMFVRPEYFPGTDGPIRINKAKKRVFVALAETPEDSAALAGIDGMQ